jgi:hypothetical protein
MMRAPPAAPPIPWKLGRRGVVPITNDCLVASLRKERTGIVHQQSDDDIERTNTVPDQSKSSR